MMSTRSVPHVVGDAQSDWLCSASNDRWMKVVMAEIQRRQVEPGESMFDQQWYEGKTRLAAQYLGVETQQGIAAEEIEERFRTRLDAKYPLPALGQIAADTIRSNSGDMDAIFAQKEFDALDAKVRSELLDYHRWTRRRWRQVVLWAWQEGGLLSFGDRFYGARPDEPPNKDLLQWLGAIDWSDNQDAVIPPPRLQRQSISLAFRYDGREGLGRTSSSQVSQAVFSMCIAPKDAWSKTSKGFPLYTHTVPTGQIDLTLRPEIESKDPAQLAAQVKEMETIRDEVSIDDWDMACMLMEQSLTENGGRGRAYISDADACDYRKLEKNRKDGFASGHHPANRKRASDSINRLVHLWVRTDTLHINEVDDKGKLRSVPVNWREKYVTIRETLERQDTEIAIGWCYEFGRSFTTFLQRPNNYIAYLLQGTIALKGTQESAKKVAHYVALRLRVDAHNGAVYDLAMGKLVEATHLPYDENRAKRTIDLNEETLRTCVREGLFRIKAQNGDILHSESAAAMLKAWTLRDSSLRGKEMLNHWKRQKVLILAEFDIERRYDQYRRISHASKPASGA